MVKMMSLRHLTMFTNMSPKGKAREVHITIILLVRWQRRSMKPKPSFIDYASTVKNIKEVEHRQSVTSQNVKLEESTILAKKKTNQTTKPNKKTRSKA